MYRQAPRLVHDGTEYNIIKQTLSMSINMSEHLKTHSKWSGTNPSLFLDAADWKPARTVVAVGQMHFVIVEIQAETARLIIV